MPTRLYCARGVRAPECSCGVSSWQTQTTDISSYLSCTSAGKKIFRENVGFKTASRKRYDCFVKGKLKRCDNTIAEIHITAVEVLTERNEEEHHTDQYECPLFLVVRRAALVYVQVLN